MLKSPFSPRSPIIIGLLCCSLGAILAAAQSPTYVLTDLGTLGGKRSVGRDLNAKGEVVGYAETTDGSTRAFLYVQGQMLDLGTFGGTSSIAHRITDSGVIVGRAQSSDGKYRPFVLYRGTQLLEPAWFDGQLNGAFGEVLGVNAAGQAVGYYTTSGDHMSAHNRVFGFEDLSIKDLGTFGGHDGIVTAINQLGHMVGYFGTEVHADYSDQRSFLVTKERSTVLPTLGGRSTVALDVNDSDHVVGHAQTAGGERHAFLFTAAGMTDLGTLPGGGQSFAYGINDAGDVVGAGESAEGSLHAVLYRSGSRHDLNGLIPPHLGWVLTEARAINAAGQIVGSGIVNGTEHAFLLTPVR